MKRRRTKKIQAIQKMQFSEETINKFINFCKTKGYVLQIPGEAFSLMNKNLDYVKLIDEKTIRLINYSVIEDSQFEMINKES